MDTEAVIATLNQIKDAKAKWASAVTKFNADAEYVLKHLIREAAHNRMSAEQVAAASGYTVKRIRAVMREIGLNPRDGKTLLEKKAAEALAANADLLGVKPGEIDLTSPLAYLPAGSLLKDAVHDQRAARVTDIDDAWKQVVIAWLEEKTNVLDFNGEEIPHRLRDVLDHYPFIDLSGVGQ